MSADLNNTDATQAWPDVDNVPASAALSFPTETRFYSSVKPAVDLITSVFLLPLLLPFIAIAWVLIKLSSRGPGFYVQTRSGHEAAPYSIIKIRSMKSDLATAKNTNWATKNDSRITVVGKILRALHLDELPQVFNVIRGEMSLVGPRPERPEVIKSKGLIEQVPGYKHRMDLRPGVTGLAQVQLPADSDILSVRHKVYYDLYYHVHQSAWLDFRICMATVLKAFLSPAALQKVLLLPSREEVCANFLALVNPPLQDTATATAPISS
jgi:lipopolysaccharide/colanic/teichoic acid biosynthesis glycosyltransferase